MKNLIEEYGVVLINALIAGGIIGLGWSLLPSLGSLIVLYIKGLG